jgi:hypothetical protein
MVPPGFRVFRHLPATAGLSALDEQADSLGRRFGIVKPRLAQMSRPEFLTIA